MADPVTWSLRRRVTALYVGIAVVGAGVIALAGFANSSVVAARGQVVDRLDPARVDGRLAYSALSDQETGIRGYALSREAGFLEPYDTGRAREGAAFDRLRRLVRGRGLLERDVREAARRSDAWHQGAAEPAIALANAGQPFPGDFLDSSKALFDAVRDAFDRLQHDLDVARGEANRRLDDRLHRLFGVLVGSVGVFVLLALGSFVVLKRWVTDPVDRLGADARRVADGDLEHAVTEQGPPEIARLSRDIEGMRARITAELAAAQVARASLDQQAAELQRSNAELEQFAYVASHDLQEPLRKVASFCQLIEKRYHDQLDDRGQQYIDFAVDGAKRMQALINDLLAFSRVGRTTRGFMPVDLGEAAAAALGVLESSVQDARATIEVGPLPTVSGDASLLTAVLQNLIANAVKFRSEEPPVVSVSAARHGDDWAVTVRDNGIGIPEQYADRIFIIFQRLHAREEYEGTGIGLAMCRKIIEFHGGHIAVDPVADHGTSITFTIPAPVEPPEENSEPSQQDPHNEPAPVAEEASS